MSYISYENGQTLFGKVGNAIKGQEGLLSDTVGWTGKNLLENKATTQVVGEITFTINADKSVTVNGTTGSTARVLYLNNLFSLETGHEYILSDGLAEHNTKRFLRLGNATDGYLIGTGNGDNVKFTATATMTARISVEANTTVNNLTFYPMIRDARISDSTYEPHHESVDACKYNRSEANVLGAKNLLENKATTQEINGVTFTVYADGSVNANGTATGGDARLELNTNGIIKAGKYIFGRIPDGSTQEKFFMQFRKQSTDFTFACIYINEVTGEFTEDKAYDWVGIVIKNGFTANNLKFYPMLRLASDTDSTYAPYAMTNRELTALQTVETSSETLNGFTVTFVKVGHLAQVTIGGGSLANDVAANAKIFDVPSGYKPKANADFVCTADGKRFMINTSGQLIPANHAISTGYVLRGSVTYIV